MKVVYPGTFDPITAGHVDIIRRASALFEELEVAVVADSTKNMLFDTDTRVEFVWDAVKSEGLETRVRVCSFDKLLVGYMREKGFSVFIRGLRANSDFEYEFQMQLMNRRLAPEITGLYLMPSEHNMYLSSTVVKEVAKFGGNLDSMVTPLVRNVLVQHFRRNR